MAPITINKKNRYPGIRSFEKGDKALFYGRSREIEELYSLIKIKPVIVLFGKSGLGKTSLLKAGVGPLLEEQFFLPLLIRLQNVTISPEKSVLDALEPFLDAAKLEKFGGKTNNKIWDYLNACSFKNEAGHTMTPILIFDQFEELFNHSKEIQKEWTTHLGALIDGRLPKDIESELSQIPRAQRTPEIMEWYTPPAVKVVFAIRSDRMSELHQLRYEIPAILQNRYELQPLHTQQAKEAIEKPAALTDSDFSTLPFSFAPETLQKIQKELSNKQNEIESFQLQIVCQYIEQKVKEIQEKASIDKSKKDNQHVIVTADFLGDADGIKNILKNYYDTQVASLGTAEEQLTVRKFLEEGLIMNKRRISVAEAAVKESYLVSDELLGKLLFSRLIRPEDTRLGRTYEISHDTLVKPILEAYEKRRIKEERIATFQKEKEEEKLKQKKIRRRNLSILTFLLVGLTSIAIYGWVRADQETKRAEKSNKEIILVRDSLQQAYLDIQLAKDSLAQENLNLLDTLAKLLVVDTISQIVTASQITKVEAYKVITQRKAEKTQELKSIDTELASSVKALYSSSETRRTAAASSLLRNHKTNPDLVSAIINEAGGNINERNINSIYQAIYILQNLDGAILKANSAGVIKFLSKIDNSGLVGISTKSRMNQIKNKLK
jgi:conflict system STAND superfamily ATPase